MYCMDLGLTPTSGDIDVTRPSKRGKDPDESRGNGNGMKGSVRKLWGSSIGRAWEPETERGWKGAQSRPPSDFWLGDRCMMGKVTQWTAQEEEPGWASGASERSFPGGGGAGGVVWAELGSKWRVGNHHQSHGSQDVVRWVHVAKGSRDGAWGPRGISHRCAGGMWVKLDMGLSPPDSLVTGRPLPPSWGREGGLREGGWEEGRRLGEMDSKEADSCQII